MCKKFSCRGVTAPRPGSSRWSWLSNKHRPYPLPRAQGFLRNRLVWSSSDCHTLPAAQKMSTNSSPERCRGLNSPQKWAKELSHWPFVLSSANALVHRSRIARRCSKTISQSPFHDRWSNEIQNDESVLIDALKVVAYFFIHKEHLRLRARSCKDSTGRR